jgi:hypothetical protein
MIDFLSILKIRLSNVIIDDTYIERLLEDLNSLNNPQRQQSSLNNTLALSCELHSN